MGIQQAAAILRRLLSSFLSHLQARNKDSKPGPKTNQYCAEFTWRLTGNRADNASCARVDIIEQSGEFEPGANTRKPDNRR
jgi:hypothetical protein